MVATGAAYLAVAAQGVFFFLGFQAVNRAGPRAGAAMGWASSCLAVGLLAGLGLAYLHGREVIGWASTGLGILAGAGIGAVGVASMEVSPVCPIDWIDLYWVYMLPAGLLAGLAILISLLYMHDRPGANAWPVVGFLIVALLTIHLVLGAGLLLQADAFAREAGQIVAEKSECSFL